MIDSIIPFYKQIDKVILKSKGCYLFDTGNKAYIDFESGDWSTNLGHSNEMINSIIKNQVDILVHDGLRFRNRESENLSEKLLEKLSFTRGKCAFLNSGSEAVNLAITVAKNLTKRKYILKIDCSYLSAYGHGQISSNNSELLNIPFDNVDSISQLDFSNIAAFVFEPGNSSSLIRFPSTEFILKLANAIKQHGGFLIANEVTTGFGRTGKWFGFQHYDFQPDIVSIGKALGNGYPISGIAITNEVAAIFDKSPFRYAQSHQNDPLGCAIAVEVINIMESFELIEESSKKGIYFQDKLIALQTKHPNKVVDIRARGLMIAVEFNTNINTENLYLKLIDSGFIVGYKENILRFMPPLIIETKHIDSLISTIDSIIS
jgi:acetylornithine/N-succinyldiaminopimelate aminotransferase